MLLALVQRDGGLRRRVGGRHPITYLPILRRGLQQAFPVPGQQGLRMQRDGIGQRQRQRPRQLPCPRSLRAIAPLGRGLYAGQLVGGLAALAGE